MVMLLKIWLSTLLWIRVSRTFEVMHKREMDDSSLLVVAIMLG